MVQLSFATLPQGFSAAQTQTLMFLNSGSLLSLGALMFGVSAYAIQNL
jgi:hypothetical protein